MKAPDLSLPTKEEIAEDSLYGINCAMQVLSFAAPAAGLTDEDALRLGAGFGAGMEHGGICGCLAAAYLVLGMRYGMAEPGDLRSLIRFRQRKHVLDQRFRERFGGVNCPDVLHFLNPDEPDPEHPDLDRILQSNLCAPVIRETCSMLLELLSED